MRLGVLILPELRWADAAERWRRAEALGFDHAWTYDHIAWGDLPGYQVDGCGTGDYSVTASVQGETVLDETGTVATDEGDGFTFEAQ